MNPSSDDLTTPETTTTPADAQHPDPLTGEAGAHPVSVGIGAIGAGIAGAAIGAVGGPIGVLIGAAIGAVAGGLAGKEVAAADDAPSVRDGGAGAVEPTDEDALPATSGAEETFTGAVPAAVPVVLRGESARGSNLEAEEERETADASSAELPATLGRQPFHDTFTGTTFRETEAEAGMTPDDWHDVGSLEEDVRTAAYFRYVDRGTTGQPGDALGDWVAAEREISRG